MDVDTKDDGIELYKSWVKEHGPFDTFIVETGSGGYHLYFKTDERANFSNGTKVVVDGKKYGIDLRGNGGQVVGPTSIHPETNRRYQIPTPLSNLSPVPDFLYEILVSNFGSAKKSPTKKNVPNDKIATVPHGKDQKEVIDAVEKKYPKCFQFYKATRWDL